MNNKKSTILFPILLASAVILGMFINSMFLRNTSQKTKYGSKASSKLDVILHLINRNYVDTVDTKEIMEKAIPAFLKDLDPHTVYIPAKNLKNVNEELKGNFGGIGVQFITLNDTVAVVRVIPQGPSDLAGLKSGDRIVEVNDTVIAGVKMKQQEIMKRLKGEVGTPVNIKIYRPSTNDTITKELLRGAIPVPSVDVAYMLNKTIGYIKVNRFAATTFSEFSAGLEKLQTQNVKKLIIDLRGNTGGYLGEAINMINEFLPEGKMIVYTKGKSQPTREYKSTGSGRFQELPVIVLVDEISASASEIFAGAIQDNDRGKIVGRRSFGKGLVQEQHRLPDGSALRLTVARYYTPTGRCIQKPYNKGKAEYYNDINKRFMHGEFQKADSIHFNDSLKYTTPKGNVVYGGGGIMPDVFIPVDTIGYSEYFRKLAGRGYIHKYAFMYVDKHREKLSKLKNDKQILNFIQRNPALPGLIAYGRKNGVKYNAEQMKISRKVITTQLNAYIARDVIDDEGYYPIIREIDNTLQKAEKLFQ